MFVGLGTPQPAGQSCPRDTKWGAFASADDKRIEWRCGQTPALAAKAGERVRNFKASPTGKFMTLQAQGLIPAGLSPRSDKATYNAAYNMVKAGNTSGAIAVSKAAATGGGGSGGSSGGYSTTASAQTLEPESAEGGGEGGGGGGGFLSNLSLPVKVGIGGGIAALAFLAYKLTRRGGGQRKS